jgi:F420-dependent oxidoreductase-like protein
MELSVHVVRFAPPDRPEQIAQQLAAVAKATEDAGVASLSLMDHYFQIATAGPAEDSMLEGYTSLGFVAAHTERVRLGLLVTGVMYRHPGLLAKIVTTVDVLSGGRAELGIGAAWYEREHLGLGVPFPPLAERFERLEETLQICLQMWSAENGPYDGKHYRLAETLCSPQPISRPHPRILIGGSGERKTLRFVATYGDACNLFAPSTDVVAHKLDVLRRHCDDVGRDYDEIAKTILYTGQALGAGDHDAFLAEMAEFATLGVDEVAVVPSGPDPAGWVSRCAPVVSRLAAL